MRRRIIFLRPNSDQFGEFMVGRVLSDSLPASFRAEHMALFGFGGKNRKFLRPFGRYVPALDERGVSRVAADWRRDPPSAIISIDCRFNLYGDCYNAASQSSLFQPLRAIAKQLGSRLLAIDIYPNRSPGLYRRFDRVLLPVPFARRQDQRGNARLFRFKPAADVSCHSFPERLARLRREGKSIIIYASGIWVKENAPFHYLLERYILDFLENSLPPDAHLVLIRSASRTLDWRPRIPYSICPSGLGTRAFNAVLAQASLCLNANNSAFYLRRAAALGRTTACLAIPLGEENSFFKEVIRRGWISRGTKWRTNQQLKDELAFYRMLGYLWMTPTAPLPPVNSPGHHVLNMLDLPACASALKTLSDSAPAGRSRTPGLPSFAQLLARDL